MESSLSKKIRVYLEKKNWLVIKVNLCSMNGYPDLTLIDPFGKIVFIESKSEGKKARPLQEYVHKLLREHNCTVHVIDTWDKFKALNL